MKAKYLLLMIVLVTGLASCKNEGDYSIIGKWQQVKLRTYSKSYSGVISHDTTYSSTAFDTSNYAKFYSNGTCVIGLFYPPGSINLMSSIAYPSIQNYNYTLAGTKYVLTYPATLISPGGFITTDTASVSGNTLLIHSVFDNHQYYAISDSYYTR
jgi:hypothetical protein